MPSDDNGNKAPPYSAEILLRLAQCCFSSSVRVEVNSSLTSASGEEKINGYLRPERSKSFSTITKRHNKDLFIHISEIL